MKIVKLLVWMGLIVLMPIAASQAAVNDFAGLWKNIDTNTRGITQLNIAGTGTRARIHIWAACHPKACDWGTVTGRLAPNNILKAYYKNNFSERILVLAKTGNHLKVDMLTRYKDNSGRPDKKAVYQFKRMPTLSGKPAGPNTKPNAFAQSRPHQEAVSAGNLNAESEFRPGILKILYPKGGEELVAGSNITIKWKSSKVKKSVSLILMVKNPVAKINVPIIITKNAPNTGSYRYRLPFKWNSRFGYRYQIVVQEGDVKSNSPQFTVYPRIDIVVQNPKIINMAHMISFKFDLKNMGIEIIKSKFMSKVAVRLNPGNAELNSAGFSHQNIVPGRTYHYKAKINTKDWDMAAGNYLLEIWADPQNNTNEHVKLRENNRITIPFRIR